MPCSYIWCKKNFVIVNILTIFVMELDLLNPNKLSFLTNWW